MQNNYKCFICFLLKTVLSVLTLSYLKTSELRRKMPYFRHFWRCVLAVLAFSPIHIYFLIFYFFIFLFFFKINIVKKVKTAKTNYFKLDFYGLSVS